MACRLRSQRPWCEPLVLISAAPGTGGPPGPVSAAACREPCRARAVLAPRGRGPELGPSSRTVLRGRLLGGRRELVCRWAAQRHRELRGPTCSERPGQAGARLAQGRGDVETLSYRALRQQVCRMANVLLAHGVRPQDRVCVYLPVGAPLVVALLACARVGAVHLAAPARAEPDWLRRALRVARAKSSSPPTRRRWSRSAFRSGNASTRR